MTHPCPFHRAIVVCCEDVPSWYPTAKQSFVVAHVRPVRLLSYTLGFATAATCQIPRTLTSARFLSKVELIQSPTARHSVDDGHDTALRLLPFAPRLGLGTSFKPLGLTVAADEAAAPAVPTDSIATARVAQATWSACFERMKFIEPPITTKSREHISDWLDFVGTSHAADQPRRERSSFT
jgi:hypothetical protein